MILTGGMNWTPDSDLCMDFSSNF